MGGLFITLEGADGAGKTTQAALLTQAFRMLNRKVLETREPGGTAVGEAARKVLLDPALAGMTPMAEVFLYAAARAQLVAEIIRPALADNNIVLCDRFTDSTLAYQGFGRGLDLKQLQAVNRLVTGGLTPHLTLVLDLGIKEGLVRARNRKCVDRMEMESDSFHQRVRQGFLELAAWEPSRVRVVSAEGDIHTVHRRLVEAVRSLVPELPVCQEV